MKRALNRGVPFLILALLILSIAVSIEGYVSIKIMKIIDYGLDGNMELFKKESFAAFILVGILLPLNILATVTRGLYINKSLIKAKVYYVDRLFKKNINEFQEENNAKYLSALTNDMNNIEGKYLIGIYETGASLIRFLVSFIVIASVSPLALFIGLGISCLSAIITMLMGKPLQKHERQRSDLFEGYTSYIREVLGAFQIIKANDLEDKVKDDFYNKSEGIQYKGYIIDKIYTFVSASQQFIMMISIFSIFLVSVYMAIKGSITAGAVILIINNMERMFFPLMSLTETFPRIISVKSLFEKIDESLENQDNYEETLELNDFKHSIEFKNVYFSYEDNPVLENIDLSLKKGGKYLIVGPSGGGKSTLLKLLRKYFNPTAGEILVDGINLKDIKKESYFKNISNVEQQVFLFKDTVKNNITLYKDYTDEEINLAIDRAGLTDFIKGLPEGLDTMIYDNGKNISGGEKSRIAIARGLLAKADIIFLDEAFASLDARVAREIEKTLLSLEGVMVVNVSHVVFDETKDKYDQVFVVKNKAVLAV
ncbi:ABC transporter ATP-binding protein [Herbinix luporum]|uniref:ABC transporter ATP-binding protein n=1 Tax=Herbinix luporum TaxID=1679721 RepID=UPI0023F032A2|nr:ABC transporter ATP-binding protein [Herbinix luporum]